MKSAENLSLQPSDSALTKKVLIRSFLVLFIPTSLLLSIIFYAFTQLTKEHELQTILIRHTAALKSASEVTSLFLDQKLSDLLVLAEGEILRKFLHDGSMKNWVHLSREFALFARRKPRYVQIRFIDSTGLERVRINNSLGRQTIVPKSEMQDKSHRYYFGKAFRLSQSEVYISPLDLNVENGEIVKPFEPTIRFATPVFDGYGAKRGIIIINYVPKELLNRISELFTPMLGHTVLLNPQGYWLMGEPEDKLWGFMFNNKQTFANEYPDVWSAISNSDSGSFVTSKGMFIFRKVQLLNRENLGTVENLNLSESAQTTLFDDPYWVLVSQISNEKIDELTANRALISSFTYLALFLLTGFISYFFARTAVQKRIAYLKLQESAVTDDLTGAANRRELNKIGKQEFLRAERFQRPLSIMMLDLDHFKRVNDSFGHNIGDQVLKHVTSICQAAIREQDFLARFGGEEFVILMPETDAQGAKQLAHRICIDIREKPLHHEDIEISITVSIGISTFNLGDPDYRQILLRADNALYLAKTRGRNRIEVILNDKDLIYTG